MAGRPASTEGYHCTAHPSGLACHRHLRSKRDIQAAVRRCQPPLLTRARERSAHARGEARDARGAQKMSTRGSESGGAGGGCE